MIIIPAIDLLDQKVVRLEKGNFQKPTFYNHKLEELCQMFAKYNIQRIHVVDLDGARSGNMKDFSSLSTIKKFANCSLEIGGGIRSLQTVEKIWNSGFSPEADKIMLGSLPIFNEYEFFHIARKYSSSIVITIDVFGETIKINGWKESSSENLFSFIESMINEGIDEFLITQIKNDGMLTGLDISLYKKLLDKFPSIKLIASGGLSSIKELYEIRKMNIFGVILGKALYENKISLEELKKEKFI